MKRLALPLNISAYLFWATATVLFKQLAHLPIWLVFAHRIVWSLASCMLLLTVTRSWPLLWQTVRSAQQWKWLWITSLLIASNWFLVIWAIGQGHLLDASLGYYFAPLISLVLAKLGLHEAWKPSERWLLALAGSGVLLIALTAGLHSFPWLALIIATTFAAYGALKKLGQVPPLVGLTLETALVAIPAGLYLAWLAAHGQVWWPSATQDRSLLLLIGAVTTVPMLLYVLSVRFLSLSLVSNLQFLNPTLMFLVAGLLFHEALNPWRLFGFGLIWAGLLVRFIASSVSVSPPAPLHRPLPATSDPAP
jgi:chloramphenicol-sensitive protein RarD